MEEKTIEALEEIALSGNLYDATNPELIAYQATLVDRLREYNQTPETKEGMEKRTAILQEICGTYGEGLFLTPPVYANFGLKHVHFGKDVYANFGCTFVDDAEIFVEDGVMFGPNVTVVTATHPLASELRCKGYRYNKPVTIGKNAWIGASAIILPGVKIGENAVIGAGAVVTKDVPSNVIVVGNPSRILREISEEDRQFYDHGRPIPEEICKNIK